MESNRFIEFVRVSVYTVSLGILVPLLASYMGQLLTRTTSTTDADKEIYEMQKKAELLEKKLEPLTHKKIHNELPASDEGEYQALKKETEDLKAQLRPLRQSNQEETNKVTFYVSAILGLLSLLLSFLFRSASYLAPGLTLGGTICLAVSTVLYWSKFMLFLKVSAVLIALILIGITGYRLSRNS